ncbi:hypothetical protein CW745_12945 [Psychromonas sp. psych-6C06]|uniref:hypothetical protein n=1 Tax=Psychromonas sp. psych-6C06 TaxID=2058089 RepID=UPI000C33F01D|nr:hypothetical protein [Psychromonas sp. psych-6C06]PKF60777.1 hypothetical protein CW745_12945 [Psychromonas sp. psych-6C06]
MIRIYKPGELSSGWSGVRVSVSVNGKSKQAYFSYSTYTDSKALQLAQDKERQLLKQQLKYARNNIKSKRSNTGFKGISFTHEVKVTESGKRYSYPVVTFQHRKDGELTSMKWRINQNLEIPKAMWQEICLRVKNSRTLNAKTYEYMLAHRPDPSAHFGAYKH